MNYKYNLAGILFLSIVFSSPGNIFSQTPQQARLPMPDHIVVVIMENHNYADIIGAAAAPHINALANDDHSALFTQYHAIEHPSQPNYLDLFAGCNQGIMDDSKPTNLPFTTDNLGRQLIDAGKTFVTFSEDMPSVGYDNYGFANYARKHNPSANWMGTGKNQIPAATNQPFTAFPTDFTSLPTVCFVVPNLINDMHDGSITAGDNWVNTKLDAYIQWAKTHNSLLIFTFDEDEFTTGGRIVTIFSGQMVKAGQYSETINHYSVLRTIEDMYGLPYACNAATATPITDSWIFSSGITANKSIENIFSVYPNPNTGEFTIAIANSKVGKLESIEIFNLLGDKVFETRVANTMKAEIQLKHFAPGSYLVKASDGKNIYSQKLLIQ